MTPTKYLDAVGEAQRELRGLQKDHADLLRKIDALQNFIRSGLALTGSEQSGQSGLFGGSAVSVHAPSVSGALIPPQNGVAIADQVAIILRSAGRPLHMKEIARQLLTMRNSGSKKPERTIFTALKRRKNQFRKVGPNTYELASRPQ